ncbi:MAG TPA: GDSL-type esterase/lipase family protein [Mycobacteriales bacterium]|nr:GDSL-type esterase/lipase family protein [Mycobacteriales bacterium]
MALRPSTRARTAALGAACAGITLIGVAGSSGTMLASATPAASHHMVKKPAAQRPVVKGSGYLALGDSVTFGYRESNAIPTTRNNYNKPRTFVGYPEDIQRNLGLKVANLACPGETSASLINPKKPSNGCENSPSTTGQTPVGYATNFPLHFKYKDTKASNGQLATAVRYLKAHPNTRLVSLMIGANDGFLCQEKGGCTTLAEFNAVLTKIGKNVTHTLKAIRNNAHYTGQIVIVQYYSLDYSNSTDTLQSNSLNGAMENAAKPFHVRIAKSFALFKKAAAQAGGDACKAQLLTQLKNGTTTCGVHPSVSGQALLAQAVEAAIKK